MEFKYWLLNESSLDDLYQSAVDAFPGTTKRQHSVDEVNITNLQWTPFEGMRTIFVKGLAQNTANGHEYSPVILFKGVNFHRQRDIYGLVEVVDNMGVNYLFERLSLQNTDVLVRCQCRDFYWRGVHFNHIDRSLYGRDRRPYEALYNPGSANPTESPILCKHLMKLAEVLLHSGIVD